MRELYEATLGEKNQVYYLEKFEYFDQQPPGLKASWNWPAFLAGGVWALYRKMYRWYFAFWGIDILSIIFAKAVSPNIGMLVLCVFWIAFTAYANSLYHGNVKTKITDAQLTIKDEKLLEYLRRKGGVHTWVVWVFGWIPLILLTLIVMGMLASKLIAMFTSH